MMRAMRWFEYYIRSIFFAMHSLLSPSPIVYFARACIILKYNFDQISCFFFAIQFCVWLFSIFFYSPSLLKSPVTKHWPFSFPWNYTHIRDQHHHACVFFMLFCLTVTLKRWLRFCFVHNFFFSTNIKYTGQANQRKKSKKKDKYWCYMAFFTFLTIVFSASFQLKKKTFF